MKFFKPQLQLIRRTQLDEPDEYFLHTVTLCPQTNWRVSHQEADDTPDADGVVHVSLFLIQDLDLPQFNYITPVAHTFSLGQLTFSNGGGFIQLEVHAGARNGSSGQGMVKSTDADEDDRPIGEEG